MFQWQKLLRQGNNNYREANWLQAEYCYRKAESLLDNLWQQDQNNEELLLAWVCTAHNLATLYEQQGDYRLSLQYLMVPHQRMLMLSKEEPNSKSIMMTAIRSLAITLNPLLIFRQKHTLCEDCYNAMINFCQLSENHRVINTLIH
jgi:hypothetical protein